MVGYLPCDGPMRGRFFQTDGKTLQRAYKEHLSDYGCWNQKDHAADWVLLEENMGEHFCIDESMLHHDLYTFLINKDGHGKSGTLVGAVKGVDEMRMKLKRAARTERKREEREFKRKLERRAKNRVRYAKNHDSKYSKNGKKLGRPRKRKNEKFEPEKLSNGETKLDLLPHVRYPLMKSGNDWTDFQKKEMKILFEQYPRMKTAYGLVCALRNIFKKKQSREKAGLALKRWGKNVGRSHIRELI